MADRTGRALVLVDLQNWIVRMPLAPLGGDEVVARCVRLRDAWRAAGHPVVVVRYLDGSGPGADPDGWRNRLVDELGGDGGDDAGYDALVTKYGLDAFAGTDLARELDALGAQDVVVAGIATSHGVAATARSAAIRGYRTAVVADATACGSAATHSAALDGLPSGVRVRTAEECLADLPG